MMLWELTFIAYVAINSNKIASKRRVYGSGRGNNPVVTDKLRVYRPAKIHIGLLLV